MMMRLRLLLQLSGSINAMVVITIIFLSIRTTYGFFPQLQTTTNQQRKYFRYSINSCGCCPPLKDKKNNNNNNDSDNNNDMKFDMKELSYRIESIIKSEKNEKELLSSSNDDDITHLPVITFDSLLPNQRLTGTTTDETFCLFLRHIGLGGMFAMISLDYNKRMLRRNGVIVKINIVDAKQSKQSYLSGDINNKDIDNDDYDDKFIPTAVDFELVGLCHCRLVGPSTGMKARVGRWRRAYDNDGEESKLGWGEERFVDYIVSANDDDTINVSNDDSNTLTMTSKTDNNNLKSTIWTTNQIHCTLFDSDDVYDKDVDDISILTSYTDSIIKNLDHWYNLVTNVKTYDNTNVVATSRIVHGQPGLRIDPIKLLNNVKSDLGERPSPKDEPTKFVFWCTAFINPVPVPLGVAPEIRGRMLEAPNLLRRMEILDWAIKRSIQNLDGTKPL